MQTLILQLFFIDDIISVFSIQKPWNIPKISGFVLLNREVFGIIVFEELKGALL